MQLVHPQLDTTPNKQPGLGLQWVWFQWYKEEHDCKGQDTALVIGLGILSEHGES